MSKIQVWETEDAMLVIWGTHDPVQAVTSAREWYEANSEVPEVLAEEIHSASLNNRGLNWADPAVLDMEESWPITMMSRKPVEGWTPYMVVAW